VKTVNDEEELIAVITTLSEEITTMICAINEIQFYFIENE
jgi:hypothetical protein